MLGRLIRVAERGISSAAISLSFIDQEILSRTKNIHAQSVLKKFEKEKYKKEHNVLYSFHAPESCALVKAS
jgi:hypothetical protein